jgi:hypothetical protein
MSSNSLRAMTNTDLRVIRQLSAAAWIAPRLTAKLGSVTSTVPSGYSAYVRICHPTIDKSGNEASWLDAARATGRQPHALMQWHSLVGSADWLNMSGSLWEGDNPSRGNLAPQVLGTLCDLLAEHTATARDCYFCLWEGYGSLDHYGWLENCSDRTYSRSAEMPRHIFSPHDLGAPRLHLPHRDYLLMTGSLRGALCIGSWIGPDSFRPQSPNLFWPADQNWFVASEIDFDSTLVGGSDDLIERIAQDALLDAWRIQPDDLLTADADTLNVTGRTDL